MKTGLTTFDRMVSDIIGIPVVLTCITCSNQHSFFKLLSFSDVYKAVYLPNNMQVAAKVLKDDNKSSHLFLTEASVMTLVSLSAY